IGQQQHIADAGRDRRLAVLAGDLDPRNADDPDNRVNLVVVAHPAEHWGDDPDDLPRGKPFAQPQRQAGPAPFGVLERRQRSQYLADPLNVEPCALGLVSLERDDQGASPRRLVDLLRRQTQLEKRLARNWQISRTGRRHRRHPSAGTSLSAPTATGPTPGCTPSVEL